MKKITDLNAAMNEFETKMILLALERAHGCKADAARRLNIGRTTLIEKMKRLGLMKAAS